MKTKDEVIALRDDWYKRAATQDLTSLPIFLSELAGFEHDYNTICYACAAAAVAATWAMDKTPRGGITGFQGGAIMWEYMEAWNHVTPPAWILRGEDLLYPQFAYKFETMPRTTWIWLQEEARKKLEEEKGFPAHSEVIAHWESIRDGEVPFGFTVRDSIF